MAAVDRRQCRHRRRRARSRWRATRRRGRMRRRSRLRAAGPAPRRLTPRVSSSRSASPGQPSDGLRQLDTTTHAERGVPRSQRWQPGCRPPSWDVGARARCPADRGARLRLDRRHRPRTPRASSGLNSTCARRTPANAPGTPRRRRASPAAAAKRAALPTPSGGQCGRPLLPECERGQSLRATHSGALVAAQFLPRRGAGPGRLGRAIRANTYFGSYRGGLRARLSRGVDGAAGGRRPGDGADVARSLVRASSNCPMAIDAAQPLVNGRPAPDTLQRPARRVRLPDPDGVPYMTDGTLYTRPHRRPRTS